jgi:hypothetical protein
VEGHANDSFSRISSLPLLTRGPSSGLPSVPSDDPRAETSIPYRAFYYVVAIFSSAFERPDPLGVLWLTREGD